MEWNFAAFVWLLFEIWVSFCFSSNWLYESEDLSEARENEDNMSFNLIDIQYAWCGEEMAVDAVYLIYIAFILVWLESVFIASHIESN